MLENKTQTRAIIFANGLMTDWPTDLSVNQSDDLIVCADGGLNLCLKWGYNPDAIIGDLDSADPEIITKLENLGVEIFRYPARKGNTDLDLAVMFCTNKQVDEIIILGAMGNRWDMTIANVMLLTSDSYSGVKIRLMDGNQEIRVLRGQNRITISSSLNDTLSLIPVHGDARGVTLTGLEYPLKKALLPPGSTLGTSNVFKEKTATVELDEGILLVTIIKEPDR